MLRVLRRKLATNTGPNQILQKPAWSVKSFQTGEKIDVSESEILRVIQLARLSPRDASEKLYSQLSGILGSVKQVQQVNTEQISPLWSLCEEYSPKLRSDAPMDMKGQEAKVFHNISSNAKDHMCGWYFTAKRPLPQEQEE